MILKVNLKYINFTYLDIEAEHAKIFINLFIVRNIFSIIFTSNFMTP